MYRYFISTILLCLSLVLSAAESSRQGSISGVVSNQATGALLRDARVEIPALNRSLLTDELGRFSVFNIPFGSYELVVSYMDLNTERRTVTLSEESPSASLDFPLSSDVYTLETFTISGVQEGNAAALTRQQTSDNIKSVVSMDAMGILANENPAELLAQLAGVMGVPDDSGEMHTINIRGIDSSMSTVTYDGAQMATSYGTTSRQFRFLNINASTFEELEVIKALTPNLWADSLGGTVNMKTKSTLNMKENVLLDYRVAMTITPSFFDYTPRRKDHPFGPLFSLDYRQIFSVGEGYRNLGVFVNLFHRNRIEGVARTQTDFTSTLDDDAASIFKYHYVDNSNTRYVSSATVRFDYKFSKASRFYLTGMYSQQMDWVKPGMEYLNFNYTSQNPNMAVSNASYTETTAGTANLTQGGIGFLDAQYRAQFGGEHIFRAIAIDYSFAVSRSNVDFGAKRNKPYAGMSWFMRMNSVGAAIDRRYDNDFPYFSQISGTDMYDVNNYTGEAYLSKAQGTREGTNYDAKINVKTSLSVFNRPVELSSGVGFLRKELGEEGNSHRFRWNNKSGSQLSDFLANIEVDPRFGSNAASLPRLDLGALSSDYYSGSGNWTQVHADYLYHYREARASTRDLCEDVMAAYLMGKTKIGKLNILAGVRFEHTTATGEGWEKKMVTFERNYPDAQTDPQGSAWRRANDEYGTERYRAKKRYSDVFPSIHFTYSIRKDLLARASWSTATGRPAPRQLIPGVSVNENTYKVSQSNPDLVSQYGNSFDLALEYYLPSAGAISIGVFRKDISDFIYKSTGQRVPPGEDNGFDGQYAGYELEKHYNGKNAVVNGLELSYNQVLKFLPKPLDRMRLIVSYTLLSTKGDYGENASSLSTKDVQGFIPENLNARIQYGYKRFFASFSVAWMSDYIREYSSDPSRSMYREARTHCSASASWKFSDYLTLDVSLSNIFNEPYVEYRGKESRRYQTTYNGPAFSVGLSGRF